MNKSNIIAIGNELVKHIANTIDDSSFDDKEDSEMYCETNSDQGNMSLRFVKYWQTSKTKKSPYYIALRVWGRSQLQLALTRLEINNGKYTWYLSKQHKTHKKFLEHNYRVTNTGYLLCEKVNKTELKREFSKLITDIINQVIAAERKKLESIEYEYDSDDAIEGYTIDRQILSRKRNKKLADLRKKEDDNTCQACGLKLIIKRKAVIECHHTDPLSNGLRKTTMDDLVCLCPTCHRIAHLRKTPYTVAEIRKFRMTAKKRK